MPKAARHKIAIRAAEAGDYEALAQLHADRNAQTPQSPYPSHELWRQRLARQDDARHWLAAVIGRDLVGSLGLSRDARARRAHVGEIRMAVRDAWQGKGVGSALMRAALDLADDWLGRRRLELQVYTDNAPAVALDRRFGFEVEGTYRAHAIRNGAYVDSHIMARVIEGPRTGAPSTRRSKP